MLSYLQTQNTYARTKLACRHVNPDSYPSSTLIWWKMIICATDISALLSPQLCWAPYHHPSYPSAGAITCAHQFPQKWLSGTPASCPKARTCILQGPTQLWASAGIPNLEEVIENSAYSSSKNIWHSNKLQPESVTGS